MQWNRHWNLKDKHAFLSASQYHWINYDNDKLIERYRTWKAAQRGTILHELAATLISMGVKLPRSKGTFNQYVNDCIGFRMKPEQTLYFSENCFGTADAISFKKNQLRIFDLKTGASGDIKQLYIYAALFCLEYNHTPGEIEIELRLYKNNEVFVENPEADVILPIMDKIMTFDKILSQIQSEEED